MDCVLNVNHQVNMHHLVLLTAKLANLKNLSSFAEWNCFDVLYYKKILTRRSTHVLCFPEVWCCHWNAYEVRGVLKCVARMYCLHLHSIYQSAWHTWFVSKVLIFYLNVYWTNLKLQVISFKVWPLGSYTAVPTLVPLIIAVLEVIYHKCV